MLRSEPNSRPEFIRILISTPSFYGLVTWVPAFTLYNLGPIPWNEASGNLWLMFWMLTLGYAFSLAVSVNLHRDFAPSGWWHKADRGTTLNFLLLLHTLGFIGVALYVWDFSASLGGVSIFGDALLHESHRIRWEAEITTSRGFQISYFGWAAIVLTWFLKDVSKSWRGIAITLALLQFVGNLLFIDRTRPTWLLFAILLTGIIRVRKASVSRYITRLALLPILFFGIFVGIGAWVGKTDFNEAFKTSERQSIFEGPIYYATCGFAYLGWALDVNEYSRNAGERVLYPLYRVWMIFDPSKAPPSQINEFVNVPMPTNVGTLLEPYVRDGGISFALLGMLVHSLGLDFLALIVKRRFSPFGAFFLVNLCFINSIGFFTPKLNSFPVWLFAVAWVSTLAYSRLATAGK
jgi:hypothetical protein